MNLDEDQKKIESHHSGNALVLAGAGSGKTRCIVERTAKLIYNSVSPKRILLMTFTNKAAREMRERLFEILGPDMGMPTVTTFHSFGFNFIHKNPESSGRRPWASLLDATDALYLLREQMELQGINLKDKETLARIETAYDLMGSAGIDFPLNKPEDVELFNRIADDNELDQLERDQIIATKIAYEEEKVSQNIIDYDDLINLPRRALERDSALQQKVGAFLADVTIDEAQDNNLAQYRLMKVLGGPNTSFMMVGDDDQSIYKFRGAAPECMQAYQDEFLPTIYRLERNYRSSHDIVNSASKMVSINVNRIDKNPYAVTDPSKGNESTGWMRHYNDEDMAKAIAKSIRADVNAGRQFGDIAVLYRVNAMAQIVEKALISEGIPYTIKRSITMLERKEIKLLTAMIRLTHNRTDGFAFATLAQTIKGLGAKRIEAILETGDPFNSGLLKGQAKEALDKIERSLDRLKEKGPKSLFQMTVSALDIKGWLTKRAESSVKVKRDQHTSDAEATSMTNEKIKEYIANMQLLQDCINERIDSFGDLDLEEQWVEAMDIITESPEDPDDESGSRVTLSTVHGAKGLEWSIVHCAGVSSTLFPLGEDSDLEEERRLAYVMMTRAKEKVLAHHPDSIYMYGQRTELMPSRFITELGIEEVETIPVHTPPIANSTSTLSPIDDDESVFNPSMRG
jgi:superfamily I DNA/RNA helicase